MNFYTITYRLSSDSRISKRYWEDFAVNRDSAIEALLSYCRDHIFEDDLFPPNVYILRLDEYLSVFK